MSEDRRAVLVTGAARGRAIAQRLVDDGLDVLACDLEGGWDGVEGPRRWRKPSPTSSDPAGAR